MEKAQHPIYAPGVSQQIRDEYDAVQDELGAWRSQCARLESEAERYQIALEQIASGGVDVPGRGRLGVDSFVVAHARAALGPMDSNAGTTTAPVGPKADNPNPRSGR